LFIEPIEPSLHRHKKQEHLLYKSVPVLFIKLYPQSKTLPAPVFRLPMRLLDIKRLLRL